MRSTRGRAERTVCSRRHSVSGCKQLQLDSTPTRLLHNLVRTSPIWSAQSWHILILVCFFFFFFYHWQSTTTVRWILLCENKTKHLVVPLNEFGVFSSQVRRLTWEGSGLCNLNDREQQRYRSRTDRRKVAVLLGFLRQKGTQCSRLHSCASVLTRQKTWD